LSRTQSGLNFKDGNCSACAEFYRSRVCPLPDFLGNERASGMEIGSFGVVSKTFVMKLFSRNAEHRNAGECAEWIGIKNCSCFAEQKEN
jgi:hypothetical protein